MGSLIDNNRPIFLQIAKQIEDDILQERIAEGEKVLSTNQFAAFYQINPATAAKGVNLLVDEGILFKKRGIGMFVSQGARYKLIKKRKNEFYQQYVITMIREAYKLGINRKELIEMIQRGEQNDD